jgi:vancomycin resistance protein YoaR
VPSTRVLVLSGAALAGALVLGYGAASATGDDRVPRGVTVAGADLGGLDRIRATEQVGRALREPAAAPVALVADDEVLVLGDPRPAGLAVDVDATVDDALSAGPLDRLRALLGARRDVHPVTQVDEPALRGRLAELAAAFDRAPREGAVRFTSEPVPVPTMPLAGRSLEVDGAVEAVADRWLRQDEPEIEVPVAAAPVRTTDDDVVAVLEDVGRPAVAAPVLIDVEGAELEIRPIDIAEGLSLETGDDGRIAPRLDGERVLASVGERVRAVQTPPVDATFDTSSGAPVVVPAREGTRLDPQAVEEAVAPLLRAAPPRRATAALSVASARVTTERAAQLGVIEVVSTFTTRHPCCRPRVQNIHRIAEIVDGHVVLPGETFSLNDVVGRRDRARGFVPAPQILRGEFVDDVGGGVSQFATTLFNAVFFAGLEDVEHSPHSYYIDRYPPGREATVSFPAPDLRFRNDSPHGVLIRTSFTGTSITVTFWGTKRYDVEALAGPRTRVRPFETRYVQRDDCTATDGAEGFDIVVTRVLREGGREVRREDFTTRYKPEPNFICGPPPEE